MDGETNLSLIEEQAFQLSRSAIALDNAWESRGADAAGLVSALNANLELWVAIRSAVMLPGCGIAQETKDNLLRLSEFVAQKTFNGIDQQTDDSIKSLINVNLQISEGLLEGAKKA